MMQILKHIVEAGKSFHIHQRNILVRKQFVLLVEHRSIIVLLSGCPEPQQLSRWSRVIRILNPLLEETHGIEEISSIEAWDIISFKVTEEWLLLLRTQGPSLNWALRWWRRLRHFNLKRGLRLRLSRCRFFRHRRVEVLGKRR